MNYVSNHHYRDTLFRSIFGTEEHKPWLLSLYNALNDSHYTNPDDLTLTTIEGVIYITMKNDISFLIDSQMTLVEHQSTFNPNMPLRGLFYFAELYQAYVTANGLNIHKSPLKKIPTPNYVVFYNGDRETEDRFTLSLSDAFEKPVDGKPALELHATVYNINAGHNESLNKKCNPLYDYCRFVNRVKDNRKRGFDRNESVKESVSWAIEHKLLNGYFEERRAEVMGSVLYEFDKELYEKDIRQEGAHENAVENARNLFAMNILTPEQIAQATGLSLDEVLAIRNGQLSEA